MSESRTENAISIFNRIAPAFQKQYACRVQLAQVFGKRWSYAAGEIAKDILNGPTQRILLSPQWGLVVFGRNESLDTATVKDFFRQIPDDIKNNLK